MADSKYFNDSPIASPEEDRFGIDPFAKTLARSIYSIKSPVGVTVALNGSWGSGKSSAVNLIRHYLKIDNRADELQIIDFKCWWFRGEEALTLAFLQELNKALQETLGDKAKDLLPRIGKSLLQGGAIIGPAVNILTGGFWGSLATGSMDFAKRFFSEKKTIEDLFAELSKELAEKNKRILIVIDDIDRLDPAEVIAIFRLVKSVGRLPNIVYLLVFDRELAEKIVQEKYPSEGPHFLEKIIQVGFELPLPGRDELNAATLTHIESLCGAPKEDEKIKRFMNVYYDAIAPFINLPRDLTRLCNSIAVSWPPIANEVDTADFVALETIRLFEAKLYNELRQNKKRVCGIRSSYGNKVEPEKELQHFLDCVSEKNKDRIRSALLRLFPIFEKVGYASDFVSIWESERRACTEKHFDTYFRMAIGDETLSITDINEFINKCGDQEYVKQNILSRLSQIRKNGKSKVPLLLDELNDHASKIQKSQFEPLISAIFAVADDIDREEDKERGTWAIGDNSLRIHWLIRKLTFERCSLGERNSIFLNAIKNSKLGWAVDFTSSAISNHYPREGKTPEPDEKCLVKKDSLGALKEQALKLIRAAADNGMLLVHPEILHILFRWREFAGDNGVEVQSWLNGRLDSDESLALLAKAFTSHSWSQSIGMFGLGDRVAIRTPRAAIDGIKDLIDVKRFRERLEEVNSAANVNLSDEKKQHIKTFLDAWKKREDGND